jgi:hypothetical protein
MTNSKAAAQRRGDAHRDGGDPRVSQAIAARSRLNTERLGRALALSHLRTASHQARRPRGVVR